MINLLPTEQKKQLQAARSNVLLLRYTVLIAITGLFLILSTFAIFYILQNSVSSYDKTIAENRKKVESFQPIEVEANSFRLELTRAKDLLDSTIAYSEILVEVARLLPDGSVLSTLTMRADEFGKEKILSVHVKGESQAIALRNNFQASTFFTNVSYGKLSVNQGDNASRYPYTIELKVTPTKRIPS